MIMVGSVWWDEAFDRPSLVLHVSRGTLFRIGRASVGAVAHPEAETPRDTLRCGP